jgi:hypothetical protein
MTMLPVLPKLTEVRFQSQVVKLAGLLGWRVWHDNATNAPRACKACGAPLPVVRNAAGLPDLILVRRPRVVWAELKAQRGKLSDDQWAYIEELKASRQEAYVWRPSDFKTIERILR